MLIQEELAQEVGDSQFPLEVFTGDPNTDHEHVGAEAEITEHAREVSGRHVGETADITGAYEKAGQVAGYRIRLHSSGESLVVPKKDVYIRNGFVEDVHLDSDRAQHVKRVLSHYSEQHDYPSTSWKGVEVLCFQLAKTTDHLAVESAGWYGYESSRRRRPDGKDWRYVIPGQGHESVAVNCHSLLHDNVWTLSTTTHSTDNINVGELDVVGSWHHWARAILWTIETAKALETSGFDYSATIRDYKNRLRQTVKIQRIGSEVLERAAEIYKRKTGAEPNTRCDFGVSPVFVPAGKIAEHRGPTDEVPHSVVTIHPKAFGDGMAETVAKHEAVHAVINDRAKKAHGKLFQDIAGELGIDPKHMD
jgi:hypothetical protein